MSCARTPFARLVVAFLALIAGCLIGTPAVAGDPLVLSVSIDGNAIDEPVIAERRDGHLWIDAADLPAIRRWADATSGKTDLDGVAGLDYRLDPATQSVTITLPAAPRKRRSAADIARPEETTPNGWGAYLNYDVVASAVDGQTSLDGALDMRLFSPRAVAFNGLVLHAGRTGFLQRTVTRLDTGISLPDLARNRRWTLGDFISGGTTASRPIRMGGIQLSTDFGLRPDLVTFPVPAIADQAALPTTADLVADGVRRAERRPEAGDFTGTTAPVTTGLNTVNVVARDALGRESIRSLSFYTVRSLLLPGLSTISLDAGFVRTGYGSAGDRYRQFAILGTYRHGVSSTLTIEAHGETGRDVATIGGGATFGLARFGAVYAAAAIGKGRVFEKSSGTQIAIGWERLAHPLSLSAQYVRSTRGYADLAARYGSAVRRETLIANIGFDLGRFGKLSANYLRLARGRQAILRGPRLADDNTAYGVGDPTGASRRLGRLSLVGATYALPFANRFSFIANVTRSLGDARALSASAGLLVTLGTRASAQAAADIREQGASANFAVARPAAVTGDLGLRADLTDGAVDRQAAAAEYIGTSGRYQAAIERTAGTTAVRAATQGAIVFLPGGAFAADRIDDSFAVVDTGGLANVPIFRDNRPAGTTNRQGYLVVPGLLPYQSNKLSLDPEALDPDAVLPSAERVIRPRDHSGVLVDFGIRRATTVVVRIVDEGGAPIPAGSRASLDGRDTIPVGMDGEVYLVDPQATNRLDVFLGDDHRCEATFRLADARTSSGIPARISCRLTATRMAEIDRE